MRKQFLTILLLCLFHPLAYGNNVHVSFLFDEPIRLFIYKPVDGLYNSVYAHDTLDVRAGLPADYDLHVDDISILSLKFPDRIGHEILYVAPDDTLHVYRKKGVLSVKGGNEMINNYCSRFLYRDKELVFRENVQKYLKRFVDADNFSGLLPDNIPRLQITPLYERELENDRSRFGEILRRELKYGETEVLADELLKAKDSVQSRASLARIDFLVDSLYRSCPVEGDFYRHHASVYFIYYYEYVYSQLDEAERNRVKSELAGCKLTYEPDFMLASPSDVLSELFTHFMFQLIFHIDGFDNDSVLAYIHRRFPDSESYAICKREYESYKAKNSTAQVMSCSPSSLEALCSCEELDGKFVLVDLWATWCVPCMMEFGYKDQVDNMLSQFYNQVSMVYVSIDSNEEKWRSRIEGQLSGLHLLASKELWADIQSKVYGGSSTPIPRYFLLSPRGELLNADLTRPSHGVERMQQEIRDGMKLFIKQVSKKE